MRMNKIEPTFNNKSDCKMTFDKTEPTFNEDNINPSHYTSHPSGIECIQVAEHFDFCMGSLIKYAWRAGLKDDKLQDLLKCQWYIERAISNEKKLRGEM